MKKFLLLTGEVGCRNVSVKLNRLAIYRYYPWPSYVGDLPGRFIGNFRLPSIFVNEEPQAVIFLNDIWLHIKEFGIEG